MSRVYGKKGRDNPGPGNPARGPQGGRKGAAKGLLTKGGLSNILKKLMATRIHYIDLYFMYDELEAEVIKNLLEDYQIECTLRQTDVFKDPVTEEVHSQNTLSVEEDQLDSAQQIIQDAIQRGIISQKGAFKR